MHRMLTTTQVTPQGMLWIRAHGPNRYAGAYVMIASTRRKKRHIYMPLQQSFSFPLCAKTKIVPVMSDKCRLG